MGTRHSSRTQTHVLHPVGAAPHWVQPRLPQDLAVPQTPCPYSRYMDCWPLAPWRAAGMPPPEQSVWCSAPETHLDFSSGAPLRGQGWDGACLGVAPLPKPRGKESKVRAEFAAGLVPERWEPCGCWGGRKGPVLPPKSGLVPAASHHPRSCLPALLLWDSQCRSWHRAPAPCIQGEAAPSTWSLLSPWFPYVPWGFLRGAALLKPPSPTALHQRQHLQVQLVRSSRRQLLPVLHLQSLGIAPRRPHTAAGHMAGSRVVPQVPAEGCTSPPRHTQHPAATQPLQLRARMV